MRYRREVEGDDGWSRWISPVQQEAGIYRLACCDCGLVHDVDFRLTEASKIVFRVRRNNRATGQVRRHK